METLASAKSLQFSEGWRMRGNRTQLGQLEHLNFSVWICLHLSRLSGCAESYMDYTLLFLFKGLVVQWLVLLPRSKKVHAMILTQVLLWSSQLLLVTVRVPCIYLFKSFIFKFSLQQNKFFFIVLNVLKPSLVCQFWTCRQLNSVQNFLLLLSHWW